VAKQDIFVDTKQLERLTFELKGFEEKVGKAAYHALNRTLDQVVTQVGRIVPKSYSIKAKEVKDSFKRGIKRPSKEDLTASITSYGSTLSLAHFPHSPQAPSKRKYRVKVSIKKDKGRTAVNTSPLPFIASTGAKSADKTQFNVFRREGKSRLPITVVRTLSIPQMITNENVAEQIQKFATEKLNERLEHEIIRTMTTVGSNMRKG
jgi:hypothetical protein